MPLSIAFIAGSFKSGSSRTLLARLGGSAFVVKQPLALHDAFEGVVPFVAGVLVQMVVRFRSGPGVLGGPRPGPCRRILDGKAIQQPLVDPAEPLGHLQL